MRPSIALLLASFVFAPLVHSALPVTDSQGKALPSIAPMLERVNPAVVNIATFSTRQVVNPLLNDPFFKHFFNIPQDRFVPEQRRSQTSAGSGVIVDAKKGTIITNFHVIKGADEIVVGLTDGRSFKASLIGADPEVDIAVLDIEGENLSELKIRNSNGVRVGDFVVAIGNPFGLGQTITTGVVSAIGRSGLGIEGYENFIQTDASINPGNSGGALVDLNGELVGINTAILAPSGGNVGIGFAIPSNMMRQVADQLLDNGEVKRGWAGLEVQVLDAELRKAFELKNGQNGVIVANVIDGSPAAKAGIKVGDLILAMDGKPVTDAAQLRNLVAFSAKGNTISVDLIQMGKQKRVSLKIAHAPQVERSATNLHKLLEGASFGMSSDGKSVVVVDVARGSRAALAGMAQGDLVVSVNRRRISDLEGLRGEISTTGNQLLLQLQRGRSIFYLVLR
ncbi:MAG: hypothetical protein RL143_821 [Pseudomonadota bacterium]